MDFVQRRPLLTVALIQLVALLVAVIVRTTFAAPVVQAWLAFATVCIHAGLAVGLTYWARLPVWWLFINGAFPVLFWIILSIGGLPAWPFGIAFVLLYLVFSNTARERVPLYLTNTTTTEALKALMKDRGYTTALDLGSGLGGVVRALDGDGYEARGVETAPLAYGVSQLLSRLTGRGHIDRVSLWEADVRDTDLVYAFLSPEPMPALYARLRQEMKPGSLFVTNSFAVPDVTADEVWELSDRRATCLYLYSMGARQEL